MGQNKRGYSQRKGILQFFKNCKNNPEYCKGISDDKNNMALIEKVLLYFEVHYEIMDSGKGTYHQDRFNLICRNNNDLKYAEMADETYIGHVGFKKWVKFYNKEALDFIIKRGKKNNEYAFLLSKYLESDL